MQEFGSWNSSSRTKDTNSVVLVSTGRGPFFWIPSRSLFLKPCCFTNSYDFSTPWCFLHFPSFKETEHALEGWKCNPFVTFSKHQQLTFLEQRLLPKQQHSIEPIEVCFAASFSFNPPPFITCWIWNEWGWRGWCPRLLGDWFPTWVERVCVFPASVLCTDFFVGCYILENSTSFLYEWVENCKRRQTQLTI